METEHRERLLALLEKIPYGVPAGWEKETFAVGGLTYLGFSNLQTEKLVVISSQRQSVIDCRTWEKIDCEGSCDEENLVACAEPLGDELIPIAGEVGGGAAACPAGGRPGHSRSLLAQGAGHFHAPICLLVSEPRDLHYNF